MERFVITSYMCPDMDGISAMYSYSEYLRKLGKNVVYYYEGGVKKEVEIVCRKYSINLKPVNYIEKNDKIILVDTGSLKYLPKIVDEKNIVQIYDHHKRSPWLDERPDIDANIEEVGAVATLIAEKFINENINISKESAILLYYGIISNTMNLKIKMTTNRDIKCANWLKSQIKNISESDIKEVFVEKSDIGGNLREEMEIEYVDAFMSLSWTMGQIEIANVEEFLEKYERKIRDILQDIYDEKKVEYISVNCMDIINGYSIIIVYNQKVADLLHKHFEIDFVDLKGKTKELISRKELIKVLREIYIK